MITSCAIILKTSKNEKIVVDKNNFLPLIALESAKKEKINGGERRREEKK